MADLPSLNALRAFDAAARHGSLTRAAAELHVTHGAVSRQIKELEGFLGRELFRRLPRGLELTGHGRQLAFTVTGVFEDLKRAVAEVRDRPGKRVINLSTVPSLAARWLVTRLARFQAAHPDIEIRVATSYQLADFKRDEVDIALRYGRGPWGDLYSERLFESCVFPVCAPSLFEGDAGVRKPADLARATLLHDVTHGYWVRWLEEAGVDGVEARSGLVLEDSNVLLQAAIEGQGVALMPEPLVDADLRAGRLVRLFHTAIALDVTFHIVCRRERLDDPLLAPFIAWLREEASSLRVDA